MLPKQENAIEKSSVQEYDDLTTAGPVKLAWRSTWLDERAYSAVYHDSRPLRRGVLALAAALAIAAIARLVGTGLGIMTSPQIDVLQDQILNALSGTAYFQSLASQSPDFAAQFAAGYTALWELIRLLGGYPSYSGLAGALIGLLFTFSSWLTYATLAFVVGRWLGAEASYGRTLGVFALAYTPVMLTVVEAVPGAYVAWSLIFLLILVAKFLAAREVFQLGPGGGLAAILLPYLLGLILLIGLLIFAAALGLNQVPYVDDILRTLRFTGGIP